MDIRNADFNLMTYSFKPLTVGLFLAVVGISTISCGGNRQPEITLATVGADTLLFERGTEALEARDWVRAREYFLQLRDNYPQSPLRAEARLGAADSLEGEGTPETYRLAIEEYRDFLTLYPTSERVDYAQYQLGMAYFKQMNRPERDQSETINAINEFKQFEQQYPDSQLLSEVRLQLRLAQNRLSESHFKVGYYYYRNDWHPGAIDRFESILDEDPGYSNRDLLYFYLGDSYQQRDEHEKALATFIKLLDEFPETDFFNEATNYAASLELLIAENEASTNEESEDR